MTNPVADAPEPGTHPATKGVGVIGLFTLSVGTMIGIGWVTLLGFWLKDAGSVGAILAFALGGAIVLPVALCYAEVTSAVQGAGGEMAFARSIAGRKGAFAAGWVLLLIFLGAVAFEAISVAWVVGVLFPDTKGPVVYRMLGGDVHLGSIVVSAAVGLLISGLHLRGVRSISVLQNYTTNIKLVVSLAFIIAGLLWGNPGNLDPYLGGDESKSALAGFISVLAMTPMFYAGFNSMNQAVNERADGISLKTVGLTLVASILVAMLFYCCVIAAAAMAAPRDLLLVSDLPAAAAFEYAFDSKLFGIIVLVAGLLGLISAWNATFFAATRVLEALAEDGLVSSWFSYRDPITGALTNGVLLCTAVPFVAAVLGRNAIEPIVSTASIGLILMFMLAAFTALRLRARQPDLSRLFAMPGGAGTAWIAFILSSALLAMALGGPAFTARTLPMEWIVLLAWTAIGLIVGRKLIFAS